MEMRIELVLEDEPYRLRVHESSPGVVTLELIDVRDEVYGGHITVPLDKLIEGLNQLKRATIEPK